MSDDSAVKRRADSDSDGDNKKQRTVSEMMNNAEAPQFRAIIKSMDAGAIIGRGGENIKRLRNQYSVSISVPDSNSPERVLQIGGEVDNICAVVLEIIPLLDDYKQYDTLDFDAEMRMLVLAGYVGAIMGSGGSKIKSLREETGAAIKVYEDCCPGSNERVFRVTSKPGVLVDVINKILTAIQEASELKPREGAMKLYDPNFTESAGGPYSPPMRTGSTRRPGGSGVFAPGGMSPPGPGSRSGVAPPRMSASMAARTGMAPMPQPPPSYYEPPAFPPGDIGAFPPRPQYDMPPIGDGSEEPHTIKVSIRNEEAGAVIGQRGSTINRVRERSGATIKIDDGRSPGQNSGGDKHRIITITGTDQQIQFAQYLMQQSVKQDQARMEGGGVEVDPAADLPRTGSYREAPGTAPRRR
jgi:heterogeneous nuclear ribonucleoprotein K